MDLKPAEISGIIKKQLEEFENGAREYEIGTVLEVGDGIARVYGLKGVMAGELIEFPGGVFGLALNLEDDSIGCMLLGPDTGINERDEVRRTHSVVRVPAGPGLLGRVVNALGQPLDEGGTVEVATRRPVESPAPGVTDRQPVREPLLTGLKAIDSMVPIGRGQRELIIGDRQTGKTAIGIDAILNQRGSDVFCIYVAVGQKASTVARLVHQLEEYGAMEYTTVVAATASEEASLQFLAPYSGCAMAEELMYRGEDVLIIYDDLSKHARAYRATSLLLRRPPGREAFPGDVFYLHSRLLERAAKLKDELGGGSITALPVVETQAGDVSAYIPTNVISITDGQIFLESELFYSGVRPAVNVGLSVSRVGGDAQPAVMKEVAGRLRLDLAQYRELAAFAQFGAELDESTRARLAKGERIVEILKQPQFSPMDVGDQIIIIYAVVNQFLEGIPVGDIERFERELLVFVHSEYGSLRERLKEEGEGLDEELKEGLESALREFLERFEVSEEGGGQ